LHFPFYRRELIQASARPASQPAAAGVRAKVVVVYYKTAFAPLRPARCCVAPTRLRRSKLI
jgi:hypothetical protein